MEAEDRPSKIRKLNGASDICSSPSLSGVLTTNGMSQSTSSQDGLNDGTSTAFDEGNQEGDLQNMSDSDDGIALRPPAEAGSPSEPPLSKNQQKKLKRHQDWEANREARKAKRKGKAQEKKQRKREAFQEGRLEPHPKHERRRFVQSPVTFVIDCGFDDLMLEKEMMSLAAQLTRCYSDNFKATIKAHLAVSSFGGRLKERFENTLSGHYQSWKDVRFVDGDFVEASEKAKEWMMGKKGGVLEGAFASKQVTEESVEHQDLCAGEIVYLTSDSPNTLTELKPYSTYIIGGLVDRNRHKGICYKKAMDHGLKTAKLPIGDYMEMTSRFVLATNHVVEIMLKWLEIGDWGEAFATVMPKRKGGVLKGAKNLQEAGNDESGFENDRPETSIAIESPKDATQV